MGVVLHYRRGMAQSDPIESSPGPRRRARSEPLGPLEAAIMRGLWKQSSGTATEITVVINGRRDAPISSKTVLTCLTRLESKGLVFHVKQNRSFRFYPALSEGQMEAKFVGEEIGEMIN